MNKEMEQIHARMGELEREITNLRQGYVIVNQRYSESLLSLKELSSFTTQAAKRSALAADHALLAARNSVVDENSVAIVDVCAELFLGAGRCLQN